MTKETIQVIEKLRKISDAEWEEIKKVLESRKLIEKTNTDNSSANYARRIHSIINELGIPPNIKGYKYVQRAILLAIEDSEMTEGVTKLLYPTLAKEFETTSSRVERAIRHAIETSCKRGNVDKMDEIFGYTISAEKGKPTNSEFIAGIADYIWNS